MPDNAKESLCLVSFTPCYNPAHCPTAQTRKRGWGASRVQNPPTHGEATDKIYGLGIKADLDPKRISLILTHATGSQVCVLLQLTKIHGVQDSTHQL